MGKCVSWRIYAKNLDILGNGLFEDVADRIGDDPRLKDAMSSGEIVINREFGRMDGTCRPREFMACAAHIHEAMRERGCHMPIVINAITSESRKNVLDAIGSPHCGFTPEWGPLLMMDPWNEELPLGDARPSTWIVGANGVSCYEAGLGRKLANFNPIADMMEAVIAAAGKDAAERMLEEAVELNETDEDRDRSCLGMQA